MRVVTLGVHVLDVLVRPVEAIPEGQGSQLVEQIKKLKLLTALKEVELVRHLKNGH